MRRQLPEDAVVRHRSLRSSWTTRSFRLGGIAQVAFQLWLSEEWLWLEKSLSGRPLQPNAIEQFSYLPSEVEVEVEVEACWPFEARRVG